MISHLHIRRFIQREIFRQFSWYAGSQFLLQVASLLNVIIVARYLGPVNLGLISFAQNYLGLFMAALSAPDFYFSWQIAKSEAKAETLAQYLRYKVTLAMPLLAIGLLLAWMILPHDVNMLVTIMMVAVIVQPLTAFAMYAQANGFAKQLALIQISASFLLIIAKMVLVALHASLAAFAVTAMLDVALATATTAVLFLKDASWRVALMEARTVRIVSVFTFLYSIRYSIGAFLSWQYILRLDQLLLATLTDAHSLGIYAVAVKIAEAPNFIGGALYTALIAKTAIAANGINHLSKVMLRKALALYVGVGTLIAMTVFLCAPFLVALLYGERFVEAVPVVRAYALSIPALFAYFFFLSWYGARGEHRVHIAIVILAITLNVGLIYILVPTFGLVGAAYATAAAYTCAVALFFMHIRKHLI